MFPSSLFLSSPSFLSLPLPAFSFPSVFLPPFSLPLSPLFSLFPLSLSLSLFPLSFSSLFLFYPFLDFSFILHFCFNFSYILTEIWLCPSEGYNASFHGGSVKNNTSGAANMESVFEPCTHSRRRSRSDIDGA